MRGLVRWALAAGALPFLAGAEGDGCGDEKKGRSSGPAAQESCIPECDEADDRATFDGDVLHTITCRWHCTEDGQYVSVTYEKEGECYVEGSTYTSDGICD